MRQNFLFLFFLFPGLLFFSCENQDDTALDPATLDTWISYKTGDGLADNTVWDIMTDDDGVLWFGTGNGVSKYDGKGWQTLRTSEGLIHNIVYSVEQHRSGDIWIGTEEGLSVYDGRDFYNMAGFDGDVWNVKALKQASNGSFWIGTGGHGFFEYTTDNIAYIYYFDDYPELNFVNSIVEDDRKNIWVSTDLGVFKISSKGVIENWYSTIDGMSGNQVSSLLADSWGHIWMGTFGPEKLNRFAGGKFEQISLTNGSPSNHVMSMMEDSRGNVWLGLLTMGVARYDGAVMRSYLKGDGLASDRILSMTEDQNGNLWFGTFDEGVTQYKPGL